MKIIMIKLRIHNKKNKKIILKNKNENKANLNQQLGPRQRNKLICLTAFGGLVGSISCVGRGNAQLILDRYRLTQLRRCAER